MVTVQVEVTDLDIELGERVDCLFCPVARAIQRAVRSPYAAVYAFSGDDWSPTGRHYLMLDHRRYDLSEDINAWIRKFDRQSPVEPFTFTLELEDRQVRS